VFTAVDDRARRLRCSLMSTKKWRLLLPLLDERNASFYNGKELKFPNEFRNL
jgi:hypothetical protein